MLNAARLVLTSDSVPKVTSFLDDCGFHHFRRKLSVPILAQVSTAPFQVPGIFVTIVSTELKAGNPSPMNATHPYVTGDAQQNRTIRQLF